MAITPTLSFLLSRPSHFFAFGFGRGLAPRALGTFGTLGVPDHGSIAWDKIVAFALTLLLVPFTTGAWIAAFLLFRFFDIVKPWPMRLADARFKNGFGAMLDDLLAVPYVLAAYYGTDALRVASGF